MDNKGLSIKFGLKNNMPDEKFGMRLHANGQIELLKPEYSKAEIDNVEIVSFYQGENKQRAYSEKLPQNGNYNFRETGFLSDYDRIYVIDTNYNIDQKVDGEVMAISCFLSFKLNVENDNIIPSVLYKHPQLFEFRNPRIPNQNAEKIGWYMLIDKICKEGVNPNEKIAIITDKDYGRLNEYNLRKEPIIENFFLPGQFSLHYARDKKNTGFLNKMINLCHEESNNLRDHIIKNGHSFDVQPSPLFPELFDRFKFWIGQHKTLHINGIEPIPTTISGTVSLYGIK